MILMHAAAQVGLLLLLPLCHRLWIYHCRWIHRYTEANTLGLAAPEGSWVGETVDFILFYRCEIFTRATYACYLESF
jgi:hypothetical protein